MNVLKIESEFIEILKMIKSENKNIQEWRAIESSDMFQSRKYCGGFDSIENKFIFSYYTSKNQEFWFEFTIEEVDRILSGEIKILDLRRTY